MLLNQISSLNPTADKLVGIDSEISEASRYVNNNVEIELRPGIIDASNWRETAEKGNYDISLISYPGSSKIEKLWPLLSLAVHAAKEKGLVYLIVDSLDFAKEAQVYLSQMISDAEILNLPKDWPYSEYADGSYDRKGHYIVVGQGKKIKEEPLSQTVRKNTGNETSI